MQLSLLPLPSSYPPSSISFGQLGRRLSGLALIEDKWNPGKAFSIDPILASSLKSIHIPTLLHRLSSLSQPNDQLVTLHS